MKEKKKNETTSREVINTNENLCISPTLANLIPECTSITSVFLVSCVGAGDVAINQDTAQQVQWESNTTSLLQHKTHLLSSKKVKVHLNSMLAHTCHGHTHLLYTAGQGLKPHKPYVAIGHLYTHLQSTSHLAHAASHCNCEIHNTQYHKCLWTLERTHNSMCATHSRRKHRDALCCCRRRSCIFLNGLTFACHVCACYSLGDYCSIFLRSH